MRKYSSYEVNKMKKQMKSMFTKFLWPWLTTIFAASMAIPIFCSVVPVEAVWCTPSFAVSVNVNPPNSGRVNIGRIAQTREYTFLALPPGDDVVVEAIPAFGYRFDNWSGDLESNDPVLNVRVDGIKNLTANFSLIITKWLIAIIFVSISTLLLLQWRKGKLEHLIKESPGEESTR